VPCCRRVIRIESIRDTIDFAIQVRCDMISFVINFR
jgi:hypothetical protein